MSQHPTHLSPQVHSPSSHSAAPALHHVDVKPATDADIAKRAYQKYEARGCADGLDREDWAAATRELRAEASKH